MSLNAVFPKLPDNHDRAHSLRRGSGDPSTDVPGFNSGLDGKPGLVPDLVPGIQGCKRPGSLGQTWDQAKSLKFILIDSIFLCPPALNTLVTLGIYPSVNQEFFFR